MQAAAERRREIRKQAYSEGKQAPQSGILCDAFFREEPMSENFSLEGSILEMLQNALRTTCQSCGEANVSNARQCVACGARLHEVDEELRSVSLIQSDGVLSSALRDGLVKVPLRQSRSLLLLRETLQHMKCCLSFERYGENVNQVLLEAQKVREALGSDVLGGDVQKLSTMSPAYGDIFVQIRRAVDQYCCGLLRMLEYDGGDDVTPATEGYVAVEEALLKLDSMQDRVIGEVQRMEEQE
jgi:hypothetical protein